MTMRFIPIALLLAVVMGTCVLIAGCGEDGGGIYCCTYESRHTACGGGDWTAWEAEFYQFNIDDYLEDWTPERVCNKFTGSDTECGGGCCIYVEYSNNNLSSGEC
jgi:hypothetical protein